MPDGQLRGGLIGCGFFAQNHLHAWADVAGAGLIAVCDRDLAKAQAAADRFGIPAVYDDAARMFAEQALDFVDVVTTMPTHRPLVELAASHRVPAICQKPFAPTLADCVAMVEACQAAGVALMVHENFRFQAPLLAVQAVVVSGRLGKLYFGRVSFRSAYDIYAGQPYLAEEERFIILDLGVHVLDVARVLLGEIDALACVTASVRPGLKGEDSCSILARHAGGAACFVDASYASRQDPDPFPETLVELDGSEGTLRLTRGFQLTVVDAAGTERRDVSPRLLPWAQKPWHGAQESVLNTQQHFIDCLRSGRVPATSGTDNLKTFAACEAAYEAAASGRTVVPAFR
ncbi:MAG: Gfo/Idh/MocA family oxidoreductase [Alphaproteobacteria bacterium]